MVSVIGIEPSVCGVLTIGCLSSDNKPTETAESLYIGNGSRCIELDTGDLFLFDGDTKTWRRLSGEDSEISLVDDLIGDGDIV